MAIETLLLLLLAGASGGGFYAWLRGRSIPAGAGVGAISGALLIYGLAVVGIALPGLYVASAASALFGALAAAVARRIRSWLSVRDASPRAEAALARVARPSGEKVFISYRRDDSLDTTGRIYDRLVRDLGDGTVFRDLDSMPLGVDFRDHINRKLSDCGICMVVIGPRWLAITDADGRRRLDDPRDHVRIEIETALARSIRVVPLLIGGASIPPEHELPQSLQSLAYRAGTHIRPDPDFHRDIDRLLAGLRAD